MNRVQHFELPSQTAARFRVEQNCVIRVTSGRLWLTVQGHAGDTWLVTGCEHVVRRDTVLWLSAEPSATISLVYAPVKSRAMGAFLSALWWRLRAPFARLRRV